MQLLVEGELVAQTCAGEAFEGAGHNHYCWARGGAEGDNDVAGGADYNEVGATHSHALESLRCN